MQIPRFSVSFFCSLGVWRAVPACFMKEQMDEKQRWHFFILYCMALSDADFAVAEREMLYTIGIENGITPEALNQFITGIGLTSNIKPLIPAKTKDKVAVLYDLARMAWADGVIEESERVLLKKYVLLFGFLESNADEIVTFLLDAIKNEVSLESILSQLQ